MTKKLFEQFARIFALALHENFKKHLDFIDAVNTNGLNGSFPIDHIIGKSDGTLGLNGELINIEVYNTALSASIIKGLGNKYKGYKNF